MKKRHLEIIMKVCCVLLCFGILAPSFAVDRDAKQLSKDDKDNNNKHIDANMIDEEYSKYLKQHVPFNG